MKSITWLHLSDLHACHPCHGWDSRRVTETLVAGFNTAWSCCRNGEHGQLWMAGKWQQGTLRPMLHGADFSIALMHHPPNWLVEAETPDFGRGIDQDFRFLLHGHEHRSWVLSSEPTHALANYDGDMGRPTPVGSYPQGAGPYGTLDQAGNVREWCRDVFDEHAYRTRDGQLDPVILEESFVDKSAGIGAFVDKSVSTGAFVDKSVDKAAIRVVRGSSWFIPAWSLRSAFRSRDGVGSQDSFLGFRCVGAVPSEH